MANLDKRLEALERTTTATEQPQSAVIIFDGETGQELTPRPSGARVLVFIPHNHREKISSGKLAGNI